VMNEFGTVGVDTLLVRKPDLPVQEVAGGCLCCAADADLLHAGRKLVRENGCDLVIVEPSGLADPVATLDLLTDAEALESFELRAVIGVLDARAYGESGGDESSWPILRDQMRFSDWLLLSKCDLAAGDAVARLEETCRSLNPSARTRRLPFGPPGLDEILAGPSTGRVVALGNGRRASSADPAARSGHLHQSYRSLVFPVRLPVDRSAFERFLEELDRREVVRAKGFVRFGDSPGKVFLFQMVYGHFLIDECRVERAPESVVVLIGPALDPGRHAARLERLVWGRMRTG
jgi:G3E family GTPase